MTGVVYYVSPTGNDASSGLSPSSAFGTLGAAIKAMAADGTADTTYLLDGTYYQNGTPLSLTSANSNDTIAAYQGANPIISGGVPANPIQGGWLWAQTLPSGDNPLEQMAYNPADFPSGQPPTVGEHVTIFPANGWSAVLTITNVDTTAGVISFNQPVPYDIGPGSRYFISDSQALLDQPGEWYFNKATQTLYYDPTAGFNGGGAVVSGDLGGSSLINVSNAQNITIRGIGFSDVATQAETSDFSTAAININSSSGITIDGNQFANVAQGVSVTGSSYNNATGYGYIRPGKQLNGATVWTVEAFTEKPDTDNAERYLAEGYLWNSGNFLFRADTMLEEVSRFEPEIARAAKLAVDGAAEDLDFLRLAEPPFKSSPRKFIDYAVMERTSRAAVIPARFQWSDIGNWDEVWKIEDRDVNGNVINGPVELLGTRNSLIRSDDRVLTAVVGCADIIVVSTADAVLVAPRTHAERVKSLVEQLRSRNRCEAIEHRKILRPWGYYEEVDVGNRYQAKRIMVAPGQNSSLSGRRCASSMGARVRKIARSARSDRLTTSSMLFSRMGRAASDRISSSSV